MSVIHFRAAGKWTFCLFSSRVRLRPVSCSSFQESETRGNRIIVNGYQARALRDSKLLEKGCEWYTMVDTSCMKGLGWAATQATTENFPSTFRE